MPATNDIEKAIARSNELLVRRDRIDAELRKFAALTAERERVEAELAALRPVLAGTEAMPVPMPEAK